MKKTLILLFVIAAVVVLSLWRAGTGNDLPEVTLETLRTQQIRSSILASGTLTHEQEVMLSTEVIGKVSALLVDEGDAVANGQLLLQIDDEAPIAMVEQQQATVRMQEIAIESAKLRLANLDSQWQRKQEIHSRGLLDDDSFEAAGNELELARLDVQSREASLRQARALLEEAQKNLSKTRVYSPLDGIVTSLDIKVGETAISSTTNVPGSSLMTIANPDSIHAEVNVDEADIANVAVGQEAEIVAIAYPDQPMHGVVRSIAVSAKQPTGSQSLSFSVKIGFTDIGKVVPRPGMSARAEIFTNDGTPVLALPIQAIVLTEDRSNALKEYHVFRVDDNVVHKVEVQVGLSDDTYQEITAGLREGDRIVVGPDRVLRNLEDGDSVREAMPSTTTSGD